MPEIATVIAGREEIRRRIEELGRTITGDYDGREPVLISVLTGSAMFLADLIRAVRLACEVDFMSISGYAGEAESLGHVRLLKDLDRDIAGRDVIVVEDIVDTGLTMSYLLSTLAERGPDSLEVCTLLDKSVRRIAPLEPRYVGFDCPDRFVIGYGLDFRERFRNLPDLMAVTDPAALAEDPQAFARLFEPPPPISDEPAGDRPAGSGQG
jgi:hypoxanthine phosphoribosyltransferase